MHIEPLVSALQSTLRSQGELANDPAVEAAVSQLITLLGPALRQTAFEIADQAASELRAQLPDRDVEVVLVEGDPMLRVTEATAPAGESPAEDLDARITLRLPPSLKQRIEEVALLAGDSVNAWVVDQLSRKARSSPPKSGFRSNVSFDL